jgi:hypothetical protein
MDVLNFISWIKRKDYRDTMPPDALTVVGVPDPTRDDRYLSIVVPISAFNIPAPYTLPIASATVLGGVKVGTNLSINSSGVLSATVPKGYVTITQTGITSTTYLGAVLTGITGPVTYEWSFADSDPGLEFTSFTNIQNVVLYRIMDEAQYLPFLLYTSLPGSIYNYRYSALVKVRVTDGNGFVYTDTYSASQTRSLIE